jgi:predicted DNA-binding protein (MmcQ/YjbR family)
MNVEAIRKICLALPAVTEDVKWEHDLVFSVGDKMFCVTSFQEPFKCSFKVADEAFDELLQQQGIIPAPYLARAKWILVSNDARLSLNEWKTFIKGSHDLVVSKLTKKQRTVLKI